MRFGWERWFERDAVFFTVRGSLDADRSTPCTIRPALFTDRATFFTNHRALGQTPAPL